MSITPVKTLINNLAHKRGDLIIHRGVIYVYEDEKKFTPLDFEAHYMGVLPKSFTIEEFPEWKWRSISDFFWFVPSAYKFGKIRDTEDEFIFKVNAIGPNGKVAFYFNFMGKYTGEDLDYTKRCKKNIKKFFKNPPTTPRLASFNMEHVQPDGSEEEISQDQESGKSVFFVYGDGTNTEENCWWEYEDERVYY